MTVHENIRKYRKEKNLTQKQLGNLCNPKIEEANIRKYELGKANPKVETLERIAAALDVPVQVLLGLNQNQTHVIVEDDKFAFIFPDSRTQKEHEAEIMQQYNKLNDTGKQKALNYVIDLTLIEKYQKEPEDNK